MESNLEIADSNRANLWKPLLQTIGQAMPSIELELTYDIDPSKPLTFYFTKTQLQKLYSLLCGPEPKTIKIGGYYFSYHGSYLGHNTDKTHASKYGFHEHPSEIKKMVRELLLQ